MKVALIHELTNIRHCLITAHSVIKLLWPVIIPSQKRCYHPSVKVIRKQMFPRMGFPRFATQLYSEDGFDCKKCEPTFMNTWMYFHRPLRNITFTVSMFLEVSKVDGHPDFSSSMTQSVVIKFLWHFLFFCPFSVGWIPCSAFHHPWTHTLVPKPHNRLGFCLSLAHLPLEVLFPWETDSCYSYKFVWNDLDIYLFH